MKGFCVFLFHYMVTPTEKMAGSPEWLRQLLQVNYFIPCRDHGDDRKSKSNFFFLDCMGRAPCLHSLIHHGEHRVVQIRKCSRHYVIRVNELQHHIDISGVQLYIINGAKVAKSTTESLLIPSDSLEGMSRGDEELTFSLRHEVGNSPTPKKQRKKSLIDIIDIPSDVGNQFGETSTRFNEENRVNLSPAIPPINSYRTKRRKGIPN
ncbi:hypothetical protein MKX03_004585 [Papaver bracteatum]|nr:hypothetical protein MKX03_004585 [Papaver bracteatum]